MIKIIDHELHIIDNNYYFDDPTKVMSGELLDSVLVAVELCLNTDDINVPVALDLLNLAKLLIPTKEQGVAMVEAS